MRAPTGLLSHPKLKATWVALAAGSLAGLAVLGACSDQTVSRVAGPTPSAPRFGVVGANSHLVQVCVDVTSDPSPAVGGKFTFAAAAMDPTSPPYPWYELKTSTDPDLSGAPTFITQNSTGPFNAATDNDVITTSVSIGPGECANVLQRANTCLSNCANALNHPGNRLWTDGNGTTNPYSTVTITGSTPAGYSMTLGCVNDDPGNPISCVDGGYGAQNVFHGSTFTYKYTAPTVQGPCVLPNAVFGLGAANPFTLLGLSGNVWDIGSNGTLVKGDAGFGPTNSGVVKKATIDGNLTKDPTSTVNIFSDFKVTGTTSTASLATASANATSASAALDALVANQTLGNLTTSQSFTTVGGTKVIDIASVNMVGKTITITGDADDVFIFNVAGAFSFRSSQMILAGGVRPSNIIWNFTGTTGDVVIKDGATRAFGVFLAPDRNFNGDKSRIVGAVMVGQSILIHSGTQLLCEEAP